MLAARIFCFVFLFKKKHPLEVLFIWLVHYFDFLLSSSQNGFGDDFRVAWKNVTLIFSKFDADCSWKSYQNFQKTFFKKNSSYLQVTRSRKSLSKLKDWKIKKYSGGVNTICLFYRTIETATIAFSDKSFDNF